MYIILYFYWVIYQIDSKSNAVLERMSKLVKG